MSVKVIRKNPGAIALVYDRVKNKTGKEVAVGFPAGKAQAYPDGTQVADVAAKHVFGLDVPERDFMGLAKDEITVKATPIIVAAMKAEDPGALFEAAGQAGQAAIQKAIIDLDDPPNAQETIDAKGSSNPLIDTSHMKNSCTYVVRKRTR